SARCPPNTAQGPCVLKYPEIPSRIGRPKMLEVSTIKTTCGRRAITAAPERDRLLLSSSISSKLATDERDWDPCSEKNRDNMTELMVDYEVSSTSWSGFPRGQRQRISRNIRQISFFPHDSSDRFSQALSTHGPVIPRGLLVVSPPFHSV